MRDNYGDHGGGLFLNSATAEIYNTTFANNTTMVPFGTGGGIWAYGAPLYCENVTFSGNIGGQGGALATKEATLMNCTVKGNMALDSVGMYPIGGGGIYCDGVQVFSSKYDCGRKLCSR